MILAAILRNFKCYKGINIISFINDSIDCMNIIIGNNGVGKSAILEGLNCLFNDEPWIINNEANGKNDVSVGAVMLIEKNKIINKLDQKNKQLITEISDFFWKVDETNSNLRYYSIFFNIRNKIISYKEKYFLLVVGHGPNKKELDFLTFTNLLRNELSEPKPTNETLSKLLSVILSQYAYIYIPVETSISDFVKLQNQSLQTLMDNSIKLSINTVLNNKRIARPTKNGREIKLSVLDIINESLEKYVNEVEKDIQIVNNQYSYKPARRQSSKLTSNHVVDTIIAAYYARRSFKKDGKEIQYLSSGEKRLILIDIISAFIKKDNPSHELIIAIDEPENSLHISNCYDQFYKIEEIALKYKHQLFITTHWYGSLPCLLKGNLIYIDESSKPNVFNIDNYYEDRGGLPDDIQLKGFYDLSSSLLFAFRNSDKNWLLVEGLEDKKYISYYLNDDKIRIIPLGGCGNVRKMFEYLCVPIRTSKDFKDCKNKIICLTDTDALCPNISFDEGEDKDRLMIRRLDAIQNGDVALVKYNNPTHNETEIEDILNPEQFYNSVKKAIEIYGESKDKDAFNDFVFNDTVCSSRIKGDYSILKQNRLDCDPVLDKQRIIQFVNTYKDIIADYYISKQYDGNSLPWIETLKKLFIYR